MIIRLNDEEVKYFSIPILLDYCSDSSEVRAVCSKFNDIKVYDYYSAYAAMSLSKAALSLNDYKLAKHFAVLSLNFKNNNELLFMLSRNLKLVNWLNNFADEIKPYFVYR